MKERMQDDVLKLLALRRGHFLLESGHHGDLWLDLELLFLQPTRILPLSSALASRLMPVGIEVICAPLVEGAFVGLLVASELSVTFSYSERFVRPSEDGLFPAGYRLPNSLRRVVRGRRVAIVNDIINAGSAVRGTFEDLESCGAVVVAIGSLLTLGVAAKDFAQSKKVALESLADLPNVLWNPLECPLCQASIPVEDAAGFRNAFTADNSQ